MTGRSARYPHAFGFLVTLAGVMVFVPDALVMRLIGGDMLTLAFSRGLLSGGVFMLGLLILARDDIPVGKAWLDGKGLIVTCLTAGGVLSWCAAMEHTSAANALLILAIAPFLAALLSWVILREKIDRATMVAIALSFRASSSSPRVALGKVGCLAMPLP